MSADGDMGRPDAETTAVIERTACPSSDVLARAASGRAGLAERRAVADHLGTCALCSEEYRVAAGLRPWAQKVAADIDLADLPSDSPRAFRPRWPAVRAIEWVAFAAAALVLLGVTTALVTWNLVLRGENARLTAQRQEGQASQPPAAPSPAPTLPDTENAARLERQATEIASLQARLDDALAPALNVPIVDLEPGDTLRGEKARPAVLVPSTSRLVTFILTTSTEPQSADHQLELVGPSGAVVWQAAGLRPSAEKTFTVTIPLTLLGNGTSRLRLYQGSSAGRRLLEEYQVRVG